MRYDENRRKKVILEKEERVSAERVFDFGKRLVKEIMIPEKKIILILY